MRTINSSDVGDTFPGKQKIVQLLYQYNVALPFSERRLLLFFGDLLLLIFTGLMTLWVRSLFHNVLTVDVLISQGQAFWIIPMAAIWIIVAAVNQCYDLKVANQSRAIAQALLVTAFVTGLLYLFIFFILGRPVAPGGPSVLASSPLFISPLYSLPRIIPVSFLLLSLPIIILWRMAYIQFSMKFPLQRRAIIVGAGVSGRTLIQSLPQQLYGYNFVGFIDDDPAKANQDVEGIPVLGNRYVLVNEVKRGNANEIILAITHNIHNDLFRAMMDCYEQGAVIKSMPLLYEEILGRIPVEHLGQQSSFIPFLNTKMHMPTFYRISKRLIDIGVALLGLLLFVLTFPFIALAIYLNSPGPILYEQTRLGKGGKRFNIFKYRSMILNAEQKGEAVWATKNDLRVTKVGRFLRQTRLDELPQLYNVLKGDMSIVGPRPERPEFIAQLQEELPFYRARLSVKPGLTGWAQIQYRYGSTIEDALVKLEYDLYYIKFRSLALDLLIILRTIRVMLTFKGT